MPAGVAITLVSGMTASAAVAGWRKAGAAARGKCPYCGRASESSGQCAGCGATPQARAEHLPASSDRASDAFDLTSPIGALAVIEIASMDSGSSSMDSGFDGGSSGGGGGGSDWS